MRYTLCICRYSERMISVISRFFLQIAVERGNFSLSSFCHYDHFNRSSKFLMNFPFGWNDLSRCFLNRAPFDSIRRRYIMQQSSRANGINEMIKLIIKSYLNDEFSFYFLVLPICTCHTYCNCSAALNVIKVIANMRCICILCICTYVQLAEWSMTEDIWRSKLYALLGLRPGNFIVPVDIQKIPNSDYLNRLETSFILMHLSISKIRGRFSLKRDSSW